ncbi:MAG: tyrosine-type recombinase/integrase [Acidobacteriaceae bacterium]|nr:tyrosine-type recombinase/integrase [Acidobacteriaceae bacterium]
MGVFRPQYKDKKTGELKHTRVWYYKFVFAGRLIKESAKTTSKTVAKEAEKKRRRELEEGFNGLSDSRDDRIRSLGELAKTFLKDYKVRQPKSATFAKYAIEHIQETLGHVMVVDINSRTILDYQTERLNEGAAPKTINEETGFLLRLLPVTHAGAIRAQLKQQKRLKLKITRRVGKAYSDEEKHELLKAARKGRRSTSIYMAIMLAQHAGLRDKEIRTLQWRRFDLAKRMITVGETKSAAGTGRTIPINDDLFAVAVEYAKWYTERFGTANPDWYVFPLGKPIANDPTRPLTTLKTAWRNTRKQSKVSGRFHDNRHTFITDLAESGAGDQVIQDLAGHVSKEMVRHYSHIRTEAKRRAVGALSRKPQPSPEPLPRNSDEAVQAGVQVERLN